MAVKLDIIIVNWNAGQQLQDCLESIVSARRDGFSLGHVVVVDNASSDGSLDGLEVLSLPLTIIRNSVNEGFGAACNQGTTVCDADYLLFLNPDTRLFENSLVVPLTFMEDEASKDVGICGIQLINEEGKDCLSYAKFPSLRSFILSMVGATRFLSNNKRWSGAVSEAGGVLVVDQIIGAFFIVRKSVFADLGGFDERFFVYFEEVDFSLRAREKGWLSVCLKGINCNHIGGGCSNQVKAARLFYLLRSRLLYAGIHFSVSSAIILFVMTLSLEFFSRSLFAIIRGSWKDFEHTVQGYAMLVKSMPAILLEVRRMGNRNKNG